jgi:hypothetical protein
MGQVHGIAAVVDAGVYAPQSCFENWAILTALAGGKSNIDEA